MRRNHAGSGAGAGWAKAARARARRANAVRECEPLLSFSELAAASSSFLDSGGMLDERWLSGREPEEGGAGHE
jgi:hypothetical protein